MILSARGLYRFLHGLHDRRCLHGLHGRAFFHGLHGGLAFRPHCSLHRSFPRGLRRRFRRNRFLGGALVGIHIAAARFGDRAVLAQLLQGAVNSRPVMKVSSGISRRLSFFEHDC